MLFFGESQMNRIAILCLFLGLTGCATGPNFLQPEDESHPAMVLFLEYINGVKQASSFDEVVDPFFHPSQRAKIDKALGWHKFAYSASYRALKGGYCEEVWLEKETVSRVVLFCNGSYSYVSPILGERTESLALKLFINKRGENWYIGRSGMKHFNGDGISQKAYGLKF